MRKNQSYIFLQNVLEPKFTKPKMRSSDCQQAIEGTKFPRLTWSLCLHIWRVWTSMQIDWVSWIIVLGPVHGLCDPSLEVVSKFSQNIGYSLQYE